MNCINSPCRECVDLRISKRRRCWRSSHAARGLGPGVFLRNRQYPGHERTSLLGTPESLGTVSGQFGFCTTWHGIRANLSHCSPQPLIVLVKRGRPSTSPVRLCRGIGEHFSVASLNLKDFRMGYQSCVVLPQGHRDRTVNEWITASLLSSHPVVTVFLPCHRSQIERQY